MKSKKTILAVFAAAAIAPFVFADEKKTAPEENSAQSVPAAKKLSTPDGWTDDFAAAKKQAAAEGKDLFVLFTGSDWCGWCIRLEKEVFSQDGFIEKLSEKFVPVFIDSPRDQSLLSELGKKQNRDLTDAYKVRGFPTVLLMDADGDVFGRTGYAAGGPEKYLENLEKITADGKFSPAHSAKKALGKLDKNDPERLKKLDEILASMTIEDQIANAAFVDEILAADPDGALGFRAKYPYFTVVLPLQNEFRATTSAILRRAQSELEKLKTKTREEHDAVLDKILAENSDALKKLLEKVEDAKKGFAENSFCRGKLDNISDALKGALKAQPAAESKK